MTPRKPRTTTTWAKAILWISCLTWTSQTPHGTTQLPQALLVPEAAIEGLGQGRGTIWTVEDGHLQKREVTLGHRLLDGRYEIAGGLPDNAVAVNQLRSGLRVGRAAKIAAEPRK